MLIKCKKCGSSKVRIRICGDKILDIKTFEEINLSNEKLKFLEEATLNPNDFYFEWVCNDCDIYCDRDEDGFLVFFVEKNAVINTNPVDFAKLLWENFNE